MNKKKTESKESTKSQSTKESRQPDNQTTTVEAEVEGNPNPRIIDKHKTDTVKVDVTPSPVFDKKTVVYLIYLLYEANFLSRFNIQSLFKIINREAKELPEDIIKYLVKEAAKA